MAPPVHRDEVHRIRFLVEIDCFGRSERCETDLAKTLTSVVHMAFHNSDMAISLLRGDEVFRVVGGTGHGESVALVKDA